VQDYLKINPQDADALEASRLLGQEFTRRSAEMEPAPAVPEPPRQITYQPGVVPLEMRGPLQEIPAGEIAGRIDVLKPPRTQAETEELRQLVQEQERRAAEAAEAAAAAPGPQKLLPPPATREGPPLQDMSATDLMDRFHFVQSWLATNPEEPRALRASELLGHILRDIRKRGGSKLLGEVNGPAQPFCRAEVSTTSMPRGSMPRAPNPG
jgi:hypothetical protein